MSEYTVRRQAEYIGRPGAPERFVFGSALLRPGERRKVALYSHSATVAGRRPGSLRLA